MEYCEPTACNVAEGLETSKQLEVEVALLINIEQAFRIALDWKTDHRGNIRKLSTLRFVARSFERHLTRVRALSEYGGYMHLVTDMKPQLVRQVGKLKQIRDDMQARLEKLMLRMEHVSPEDDAAFEGICGELEGYLTDLASHAQLEMELLQQCFAEIEGGSG
jgi:hypothetical protein